MGLTLDSQSGFAKVGEMKKKLTLAMLNEAIRILGSKGGKIGGKSTSPAKQRAARKNGNWRARKK